MQKWAPERSFRRSNSLWPRASLEEAATESSKTTFLRLWKVVRSLVFLRSHLAEGRLSHRLLITEASADETGVRLILSGSPGQRGATSPPKNNRGRSSVRAGRRLPPLSLPTQLVFHSQAVKCVSSDIPCAPH